MSFVDPHLCYLATTMSQGYAGAEPREQKDETFSSTHAVVAERGLLITEEPTSFLDNRGESFLIL